MQVASLAAAEKNVPFKPVEPTVIKGVPSIFVTNRDAQPDWQMVVLVYGSSNYGPVQIFERTRGFTQAGLDQWSEAGYCTSCSFAESVVLAGGQRATVLGTPETTTAAHWIQDDFQIDVVGPYSSLTRKEAIAIADNLSLQ
jgi:hypothetical protein